MLQVPVPGRHLIGVVADSLALLGEDRAWMEAVCENARRVDADVDLATEGKPADSVHVLLSGLAVRYRSGPDGREQHFGFVVPGSFCDLHGALLARSDHSVKTMSACVVASIERADLLEAAARSLALTQAFWWCALLNEAMLREWIANLALKTAHERLAHLFCEFHARLSAVGLVQDDNSFLLPLTQDDLASTVGLSSVHVNRSLRALREADLVQFQRGVARIPSVARLRRHARFSPDYLKLGERPPKPSNHRAAGPHHPPL